MKTEPTVRDLAAVTSLLDSHRNRKAEIDTRDKDFDALTQKGQRMIDNGHFATPEVSRRFR